MTKGGNEMTMPPGAGPFSYEGDTVAAKLSIDVPADALANLKQVTQGAHDLRVNMEAAARAQSDFVEYLRDLPALMAQVSEANQRLTQSMERTTGIESGRNDATQTNWGQPEIRLTHEGALQDLAERNPRQFANLMAQEVIDRAGRHAGEERVIWSGDEDRAEPSTPRRPPPRDPPRSGAPPGGPRGPTGPGNRGPGRQDDEPEPSWVARLKEYQDRSNSFMQTIMNETRAGGTEGVGDIAGAGLRGVRGIAGRAQEQIEKRAESWREQATQLEAAGDAAGAARAAGHAARLSGVSGAAGMALKGAGAAGLVIGGLAATQNVGEWYQGLAAQGMQRGGGFEEGAAFEMQTRTMAMNPFISLEQSRKIMQSALSQGYTGKEFDTVTEFMTENLTKMNIDVAQSVKVLQNQVQLGGQSLAGAQAGLETVHQLAANPDFKLTGPETMEIVNRSVEQGIGVGLSGAQAAESGNFAGAVGGEDFTLKGKLGPAIENAFLKSPAMQQRLAAQINYSGPLSGAYAAALETMPTEQVWATATGVLDAIADECMDDWNSGDISRRKIAEMHFQQVAASIGVVDLDIPMIDTLLEHRAKGGTISDYITEADTNIRTAETGGDVEKVGTAGGFGNTAKGALGFVQSIFGKAAEYLAMPGSSEREKARDWAESGWHMYEAGGAQSSGTYTNERITGLVQKYGTDIEVKDANGKTVKLDEAALGNKQLMEDIVSGAAQIKVPGGEWTKLENLAASSEIPGGAGGTFGGTFDLTPDAAKLLKLIPEDHRTPNETSSDGGTGGSRNNPPPGEKPQGGG